MNITKDFFTDLKLQTKVRTFYNTYGAAGLEKAMQHYTDMQQEYICRTKTSFSKITIGEIYYLEIREHNISVHTHDHTYHKYGSLNKEWKLLAPYGFVKCNQSCIVSLDKIRTIVQDNLILINGVKIHISRTYAAKTLMAFSRAGKD